MPDPHNFEPVRQTIIARNQAREEALLCPFACRSEEAVRRDPDREKTPDWENIRAPFFHDADKILHSSAYTRYIDKTQTFYLFQNDLITHRVLHVQFVSKIARTLARCLRLNEDLTEAIALGHDIGHVPFGHDGERFLDEICRENGLGAFCHNAQSVRWMVEIEKRGQGLNLCLQTLDGMLTHNGEMWNRVLTPRREKTWDHLMAEYHACLADAKAGKSLCPMTLEGCVVRFADVIAYVGRDIEDAIKLDLITRDALPAQAAEVLGQHNSAIINTLVTDLIANSMDADRVAYSEPVHQALLALLKFNYENIYLNPRVREDDAKMRTLFQTLFARYQDDWTQQRADSPFLQFCAWRSGGDYRERWPVDRLIIDFLSGMTDEFFLKEARRIFLPRRFGQKAGPER